MNSWYYLLELINNSLLNMVKSGGAIAPSAPPGSPPLSMNLHVQNELCSKLLDGGVNNVCNLILCMLASYLLKQISAIFCIVISKTVPFSSSIHTASVRCWFNIDT